LSTPRRGQSFSEAYELDDTLLDIENKSLTHRPDTFGIIGFAREIAGITDQQFITPEWLKDVDPPLEADENVGLVHVTIDDPGLSDRYQAVVISGAQKSALSPLWLQTYLSRSGVRPINAIVDVTNYLMLLTGQPLHAFDYDKLLAMNGGIADIHVRGGRGEGDRLILLDGREIELDPSDIVIANGQEAIALAGAMGGAATEIDETTENIIIESATFNLYNLRATQMRHGIFSEAITRFTKGQPATLTAPVLAEAVRLLNDLTGSHLSHGMVEAYPHRQPAITIDVSSEKVSEVLGKHFSPEKIATTLGNVEFVSRVSEMNTQIEVPYWRSDIHQFEDIVEEVGRLSGYDIIEPTLPARPFTAVRPSPYDLFRASLRRTLARSGANEVLTYSFVHGDVLKKAGQEIADSYKLVNSMRLPPAIGAFSAVPSID
jgi:phenylalanyl-tRNA synthetase beta chain